MDFYRQSVRLLLPVIIIIIIIIIDPKRVPFLNFFPRYSCFLITETRKSVLQERKQGPPFAKPLISLKTPVSPATLLNTNIAHTAG